MKKIISSVIVMFSLLFGASLFAGDKEDAMKLVDEAIKFFNENGEKKAIEAINDAKGKFVKGELYVFLFDVTGKCIAHGNNPKLIGKDLSGLTDPDKKEFIKEFGKVATTKGSGWVDYQWTNPATKKIEPKSSYIKIVEGKKVGDKAIYMGCGIYKK